jgi:hypothetical protein
MLTVGRCRPAGVSVAEGCRLMGLARSTYYDRPQAQPSGEAQAGLASERDAAQRALGGIVGQTNPSIVEEARERCPSA